MKFLFTFNEAALAITSCIPMGTERRANLPREEQMQLFVFDALCLGKIDYGRWRECLSDITLCPDSSGLFADTVRLEFNVEARNALNKLTLPEDRKKPFQVPQLRHYQAQLLQWIMDTYLEHNKDEFAGLTPQITVQPI